MRIVAVEPLSALSPKEHELIRNAWDDLPEKLFSRDAPSLRVYVIDDERGRRRVIAPIEPRARIGDAVSGHTSEVAFSEMGSDVAALPLLEIANSLRRTET